MIIQKIKDNLITFKDLAANTFLTLLVLTSITTAIISVKVMQLNIDSTWNTFEQQITINRVDDINLSKAHNDSSLPSSLFNMLEQHSRAYNQSQTRLESIFPTKQRKSISQNKQVTNLLRSISNLQNPEIIQKVVSIIEELSTLKMINKHSSSREIIKNTTNTLESIQKEIGQSDNYPLITTQISEDIANLISEIKILAGYYDLQHLVTKNKRSLHAIKEGIASYQIILKDHNTAMRLSLKNTLLKLATILIISFSFLTLMLFYTNKSPKLTIKGDSKKKRKKEKYLESKGQLSETPKQSETPQTDTNLSKLMISILQDMSFFIKQSQTEIVFKDNSDCNAKVRKLETTNNLKKLINGIIRLTKKIEHRNIKIILTNVDSPKIQISMEHLELTEELLWENWITDTHSFLCLDEILDQIEQNGVKVHLKNHYEEQGKFINSTIEFEFQKADEPSEVATD